MGYVLGKVAAGKSGTLIWPNLAFVVSLAH
jgi:hypothetical protein